MKRRLATGLFLAAACSPAPRFDKSHSLAAKTGANSIVDHQSGNSEANQEEPPADSGDGTDSAGMTPSPLSTDPATDNNMMGSPGTTVPPDMEKPPMDSEAQAKLERIPTGCTDKGTVTDKDLVLFNGEAVKLNTSTKSIDLNEGWKIDDSWNAGRIGVGTKRDQPVLTFDNETFYNGFKITPPSMNGARKTFVVQGMDLYYDTSGTTGSFGIRIIKPNENEGGGDFDKRTWIKADASGAGKEIDVVNFKTSSDCKIMHMYTPKAFIDAGKVANRFILEIMPPWNKSDKLYVYKIVLKGVEWK